MSGNRVFFVFVFLVLIDISSAQIQLTEIMYNPIGSDNDKEYIELFNPEKINLTDYIVGDLKSNDSLDLLQFSDSNYSLITESGFNLTGINASVYSAGATIGNNLGNTEDSIYFYYPNKTLIFNLSYTDDLADGNGFSLSLVNDSWVESIPTPGEPNVFVEGEEEIDEDKEDIVLSVYLDDEVYDGFFYDDLFKIKISNKDNCSNKDWVNVSYNVTSVGVVVKEESFLRENIGCSAYSNTGEFDLGKGEYVLCGWVVNSSVNESNLKNNVACANITVLGTEEIPCNLSINIATERFLYYDNESVKFYNNLNNKSLPYSIGYWVEDLSGNIVKKKYNTSNTNKKSYSPRPEENDMVLLIKSRLYAFCNDSNLDDNSAEKMIIVRKAEYDTTVVGGDNPNSSIVIDKVYIGSDKKVKFGENARVKLKIYKGNTRKSALKIWVEGDDGKKVTSSMSQALLKKKYTNYEVTLPFQIKSNCDGKFSNGDYTLVVDGLNISVNKSIKIEGMVKSICTETIIEECEDDAKQAKKRYEYSLIEMPLEVQNNEPFLVKVRIKNNHDEKHKFEVYSYVYRGSKAYSEREINKKNIEICAGDYEDVSMKIKVSDAKEGSYKMKVKIRRDELKTAKQITTNIDIVDVGWVSKNYIIEDFYTLARNFDDNINMFAKIKNNGDKKVKLDLILDYSAGQIEEKVSISGGESEKVKFNVDLINGKNLFVLRLVDDNETIDYDHMSLVASGGEIKVLEEDEVEYIGQDWKKDEEMLARRLAEVDNKVVLETGTNVVYESTDEKVKKMIGYFLISLLIFITVVLIAQ